MAARKDNASRADGCGYSRMNAEHLLNEMVGLVGRIENLEERQSRKGLIIPSIVAARREENEIAELKAAVARLIACVETLQGQVEWVMDKFEEWNVES